MRSKITTADEAIALIREGDTLTSTGFVQTGFAEALLSALEHRFRITGTPQGLTLFAAAGQGDGKTLGLSHLGHEGLLHRVVAGHLGRMPMVARLALDNRIQAYNLPQGIIVECHDRARPAVCLARNPLVSQNLVSTLSFLSSILCKVGSGKLGAIDRTRLAEFLSQYANPAQRTTGQSNLAYPA